MPLPNANPLAIHENALTPAGAVQKFRGGAETSQQLSSYR